MMENISLILDSAKLANKSEKAVHGTPPAKQEKIATLLPRYLVGLKIKVNNNVP